MLIFSQLSLIFYCYPVLMSQLNELREEGASSLCSYQMSYERQTQMRLVLCVSPMIQFVDLNCLFHFLKKRMIRSQRDVQEEIREKFLPRPDKYKDLQNTKQIPMTNQSCVVIPCLTKTYGFKTNQYKVHEKYLKGVIEEQDFTLFVRKANGIIERQLINKENQEDQPFFKFTSRLLKISIVLSALALTLMAVITYTEIQHVLSEIILYLSVVLLGTSSLVAALCPIFLYKSKYTSLNYQHIISQKLKELYADQNKKNEAKGLNHIIWKIQNNFYWIQMHINRRMVPKEEEEINEDFD